MIGKVLSALVFFGLGVAVALGALWRVPSLARDVIGPEWALIRAKQSAVEPSARKLALIAYAKAVVADNVFDPTSVLFSDVDVIDTPEGLKVCGYVNARNRMGAYVGRMAFAFDPVPEQAYFWEERKNVVKDICAPQLTVK